MQELLSAETYKRRAEIEEKHKLHIAKVKIEEENKNLHKRISELQASIEQEQNALLQAKQQAELIKAENGRLKEQMVEKEYQLKHIKIEVDHMKDRIIETKERLLDIEKRKKNYFTKLLYRINGNLMKAMPGLLLILPILMAARNKKKKRKKKLQRPTRSQIM